MGTTAKYNLLHYCDNFLKERIDTLTMAISDSRISSWQDTKSSAGDKYETSREMIQGEIAQNARQLEEAQKLITVIEQIKNASPDSNTIVVGSLVQTDKRNFFIGIPIGVVELEQTEYAIISSSSPIGLILMGKKKGDVFQFQNKTYTIENIY
jgi:transcription elongation GreA/GreB family factor